MQLVQDKATGKIIEVLENQAQEVAYTVEFLCDKDLKKMRKVREELNKRIDNLADEENKVLRQHRITVERALVYSLGRKTVQMQKGLYYALLEIQPNASFCYKSDIKKLKEKYKIVEDSDESSKEIQAK